MEDFAVVPYSYSSHTTRILVLSNERFIRDNQLLQHAGITQSETARRLGVNRSTIQKYRDGRIKNPSLIWFLRLAEACGARMYVDFSKKSF